MDHRENDKHDKDEASQEGGEDGVKKFKPGENPESDESERVKGDNNTPDGADAAQETHVIWEEGGEDGVKKFKPGENPESDESERVKGDNNTPDGADAAQETHGTQDNATGGQGAPESETNGGVRAEATLDEEEEPAVKNTPPMIDSTPLEATESIKNQGIVGSNEGVSCDTQTHAQAPLETLSNLSIGENVTGVCPPGDKVIPELSTSSEFASEPKEQEKLSQGNHGVCVASKPEYGNADSDISKSDEVWEHLSAENQTVEHEQNDQTSGKEPIKEKSQVHQDDSRASQPEQHGISDDTVRKEEPNNNPQPNDGPGPSPSSGPNVPTVEAAPGETKPEFEGDIGKQRPPAEVKRLEKNAAEGEQLVSENKANEVKENEQSGNKEDEKRPVSISLCTSAYDFNVKGLESFLNGVKKKHPELIKKVKTHQLPYNDLDSYRFSPEDPIDVMILCHSINNRRFAITDVMDALYDKYLPFCASVIGKAKMGVIVHDFVDMRDTAHSSRMDSFKSKQPKAFETTSLQITCGHIETEKQVLTEMRGDDRNELMEFLKTASKHPEKMMDLSPEKKETKREKVQRMAKEAKKFKMPSWDKPKKSDNEVFAQPQAKYRKQQDSHSSISTVNKQDEAIKRPGSRGIINRQPAKSCEPNPDLPKPRNVALLQEQVPGTSLASASSAQTSGSTYQQSMTQSYLPRSTNDALPQQQVPGTSSAASTAQTSGSTYQQSMTQSYLPRSTNVALPQQQVPGTSSAAQTSGSPYQQAISQSPGNVVTSTTQSSSNMTLPYLRPVAVSVCTSAYEHNVTGFMSWLRKLKTDQPHMIADVRFQELPYNDIDHFKFPQADPVDVMVLCHSVQNRGFSITDVLNSIYDKYLKHCHNLIGKKKLAVIVHDLADWKPQAIEVKMESFQRLQPSTFKLVDTVIICGSLEHEEEIEMGDTEKGQLLSFLKKAMSEPKEKSTSKQSYISKITGFFDI